MKAEKLREITRCANDIEYFAEKYIKITTNQGAYRPLYLNSHQRKILKDYKNKVSLNKTYPRQCGATTMLAVIALYEILFKDNNVGLIFYRFSMTKMLLARVEVMYNDLPKFIKKLAKVESRNYTTTEFNNGKSITIHNIAGCHVGINYNNDITIVDLYNYIDNDSIMNFIPSISHSWMFKISTGKK
jgi:hypothetical protein